MVRAFVCWCAVASCTSAFAQIPESHCKTPEPIAAPTALTTRCDADASVCESWRRFRVRHPYPYQVIALDQKPGANMTLILSEPPPISNAAELIELVKTTLNVSETAIRRLQYPVGLDGWLEDLTITLPTSDGPTTPVALSDGSVIQISADLANRLEFLSTSVFGTRRGFYLDKIPDTDSTPAQLPLPDLHITIKDITSLAQSKASTWLPLSEDSARTVPFKDISSWRSANTFQDLQSGIVVLLVPPNTDVRSLRGPFRLFAVASDHIVGALKPKGGGLLLLARARTIPLNRLPPLRFETLVSLINSSGQPLGQSYERQRIFAGKISDGKHAGWDWAPIYLSPQLQDSEFGVLLNLADQQLKSWSQCSQVRYATFDYPDPNSYPFGNTSASNWMFERTLSPSLIFNWNTRGFVVATETPQGRVVSSAGTAALPVSYIVPDEGRPPRILSQLLGISPDSNAPLEASGIGSDYFARLGDPLLARVVQNVLLYQIIGDFKPFQMRQAHVTDIDRTRLVGDLLESQATTWLQQLLTRPAVTLTSREGKILDLRKSMQESELSAKAMAGLLASPQRHEQRTIKLLSDLELKEAAFEQLAERRNLLRIEINNLIEKSEAEFRKECHDLNGTVTKTSNASTLECSYKTSSSTTKAPYRDSYTDTIERLMAEHTSVEKELQSLAADGQRGAQQINTLRKQAKLADAISNELRQRASNSSDLEAMLERVLATTKKIPSQGSIRTPSVVLSRNVVEEDTVGGHNIDGLPMLVREGGAKSLASLHWIADTPTMVLPKNQIAEGATVARAVLLRKPPPEIANQPLPDKLQLSEAPKGSILEKLAAHGKLPEPSPELLRNAEQCACDIYVQRMDANTTGVVRLGPPVVPKVVFGDAVLMEELATPPIGKRVLMAGFAPTRAMAVGEGMTRLASAERDTSSDLLSSAIRQAKKLYARTAAATHAVTERLSTRAGRIANVSVEGDADVATLRKQLMQHLAERPEWKTASAVSGTNESLPRVPLVEIRFQTRQGSDLDKMQISVHDSQGNPVVVDATIGVARSELARIAKLKQSPLVEDVARDMTDRMLRDLTNAREVDIYLKGLATSTALRLERKGNTWVLLAKHGS